MHGSVEVYINYGKKDQQLILSESNMIVDAARATIVDILTLSPDTSAGQTAILNVSSWIPRVLSFGKDNTSFSHNLHSLEYYLPTSGEFRPAVSGISILAPESGGDIEVSSINSNPDLPSPIDTLLDKNLPGGQYLNYMEFSGSKSLSFSQAVASGAYAPADGVDFTVSDTDTNTPSTIVYRSAYNLRETMDAEGFIHLIDSTDPSGALIVSSNSDFSSTREVIYRTQMNVMDENLLRLYGGITNMGIWTIDVPTTMLIKTFPMDLAALNLAQTRLTHRLFAKKTFSTNLIPITKYIDTTTGTNLDIIWRITL